MYIGFDCELNYCVVNSIVLLIIFMVNNIYIQCTTTRNTMDIPKNIELQQKANTNRQQELNLIKKCLILFL